MKKPAHPGAILREDVIKQRGITVVEAADRLGVSRVAVNVPASVLHAPGFL